MAMHVLPVVAVAALMLLVSFVLTGLANPLALAYGAAATLAVTLVKDRRTAIGLGVGAALVLAVVLVVLAQPAYVTTA